MTLKLKNGKTITLGNMKHPVNGTKKVSLDSANGVAHSANGTFSPSSHKNKQGKRLCNTCDKVLMFAATGFHKRFCSTVCQNLWHTRKLQIVRGYAGRAHLPVPADTLTDRVLSLMESIHGVSAPRKGGWSDRVLTGAIEGLASCIDPQTRTTTGVPSSTGYTVAPQTPAQRLPFRISTGVDSTPGTTMTCKKCSKPVTDFDRMWNVFEQNHISCPPRTLTGEQLRDALRGAGFRPEQRQRGVADNFDKAAERITTYLSGDKPPVGYNWKYLSSVDPDKFAPSKLNIPQGTIKQYSECVGISEKEAAPQTQRKVLSQTVRESNGQVYTYEPLAETVAPETVYNPDKYAVTTVGLKQLRDLRSEIISLKAERTDLLNVVHTLIGLLRKDK